MRRLISFMRREEEPRSRLNVLRRKSKRAVSLRERCKNRLLSMKQEREKRWLYISKELKSRKQRLRSPCIDRR